MKQRSQLLLIATWGAVRALHRLPRVADEARTADRMRRERSPSNSLASEERAPKRARQGSDDKVKDEFLSRQREHRFRELHHPERLLAQLLAQRQHALTAQPAFAFDMKMGALTGPRLKGLGLLKVCGSSAPALFAREMTCSVECVSVLPSPSDEAHPCSRP